ncbi:MAG TPA: 5-formyltetrahydrofolate cyclo-ligase [Nitrospirota bacterium]|jgi:5-formyltetrahydrofolate cyclo-ligase
MEATEKAQARHGLLIKRDALDPEDRRLKSVAIGERLLSLPEYKDARVIMFYISYRSEVATRPIIESALKAGKRVVVPKVDRKTRRLRLFEISDLQKDLEAGYMGIYEPVEKHAVPFAPEGLDLIIMPGVGFDAECRRIGYGGGYYDKLLEEISPRTKLVAVAFEVQMMDKVPSEEHDRRVHRIITESRVVPD